MLCEMQVPPGAARLSRAGGDVDAVAVDLLILLHHVAEVSRR
jgi:hypothetical protein